MLSKTELENTYGSITNDTSSSNKSFGLTLMNEIIRQICSDHAWDFLEAHTNISTVASTQFYDLPNDYLKLIAVEVTIGSTQYVPLECPNRRFWEMLNSNTSDTSDTPQYYFVWKGQIGFYPTPASSTSNAIGLSYRKKVVDLSMADYTTGTVDIITNGSGAVTGAGTTWTAPMIDRYLRVTQSDTATAAGDHQWYKISAVGSTTTLTLDKNYEGTSLTTGAGAAYTIGEMPILPEAFHMLPVYYAAMTYFATKNVDSGRFKKFQELYTNAYVQLRKDHGRKSSNVVVVDEPPNVISPNLAPSGLAES